MVEAIATSCNLTPILNIWLTSLLVVLCTYIDQTTKQLKLSNFIPPPKLTRIWYIKCVGIAVAFYEENVIFFVYVRTYVDMMTPQLKSRKGLISGEISYRGCRSD